jgi:hypothetical protein
VLTSMANKLRCRLGKHQWRTRGRGDALTYVCQVCGKAVDRPPGGRMGATEAHVPPGTGGGAFGGGL